jgi:hypothetical protein
MIHRTLPAQKSISGVNSSGYATKSKKAFSSFIKEEIKPQFNEIATAKQRWLINPCVFAKNFAILCGLKNQENMEQKDIKTIVKEKYGQIALQSEPTGCCGPVSDCCGVDYTIFSENYESQQGYNKDADLGLGCGIPTEFAGITSRAACAGFG